MTGKPDRFGDKPRVPPGQWHQGPIGGHGPPNSGGCLIVLVGFVLAVVTVLW